MLQSGPDRAEYNQVGPSRGHKIYFFRDRSGLGQDIKRQYGVGVPKTLPRRTLVETDWLKIWGTSVMSRVIVTINWLDLFQVSLFKFVRMAGDLLPPSLFIPYINMLRGLANGPESAHQCFNFLKSNGMGGGEKKLNYPLMLRYSESNWGTIYFQPNDAICIGLSLSLGALCFFNVFGLHVCVCVLVFGVWYVCFRSWWLLRGG